MPERHELAAIGSEDIDLHRIVNGMERTNSTWKYIFLFLLLLSLIFIAGILRTAD